MSQSQGVLVDGPGSTKRGGLARARIVKPGESGYDDLRQAWNRLVDQRPAAVLQAYSARDVAEAVLLAQEQGRGVAIQATGHGVARPADDAVLILTKGMQGVEVNAEARTATVGAGSTWGSVLTRAQEVGLAPLLGSAPHVGAVGYTLGGGIGWLARKHGLAADAVRSFEVVTADGQVRRVDETEHPDLFWALRGGGGGCVAVVTAMEVELVPVTKVYGGNLMYPATEAREVMRRYRDWIADMPREMSSSVVLFNFPPLEVIPEPLRGQSFVIVRGCHCGATSDAAALVDRWRSWRRPTHDFFGEMPFSAVATISNDPIDPLPAHASGEFLRSLDDAAIDSLVSATLPAGGPPTLLFVEVRHVAGAMSRPARAPGAFSHRDEPLLLEMVGVCPSPEAVRVLHSHVSELKRTLGPNRSGKNYMNFLDGEEKRSGTARGFTSAAMERLRAVKAKYDPDNLFRFGFDIPPAHRADVR